MDGRVGGTVLVVVSRMIASCTLKVVVGAGMDGLKACEVADSVAMVLLVSVAPSVVDMDNTMGSPEDSVKAEDAKQRLSETPSSGLRFVATDRRGQCSRRTNIPIGSTPPSTSEFTTVSKASIAAATLQFRQQLRRHGLATFALL